MSREKVAITVKNEEKQCSKHRKYRKHKNHTKYHFDCFLQIRTCSFLVVVNVLSAIQRSLCSIVLLSTTSLLRISFFFHCFRPYTLVQAGRKDVESIESIERVDSVESEDCTESGDSAENEDNTEGRDSA